jgi:hypothetical protein
MGDLVKKRAIWYSIPGLVITILFFVLAGGSISVYHVLFLTGLYVIGYSVYRKTLPQDERSKRIDARSQAWSWYATFFAVIILLWFHALRPGSLSVPLVLMILYLFMLVSAAIFRRWLNHRGNIE